MKVINYAPGKPIDHDGVYSNVPIGVYHGPSLCSAPHISSSGLRTIFTEGALEYWANSHLCPDPEREGKTESESIVIGRAAHHACLGESDFSKHFAVRPEEHESWRTTASKKWRAEQELKGMTVLTPDQLNKVRAIAGLLPWQKDREDCGLLNHSFTTETNVLNGLIEHSIVWKDAETGVWLAARPDAIPLADAVAADLKTTTSIRPDKLRNTINEYRYDMQAALIRMGLRAVCGIELTHFSFVFVQNCRPFAVHATQLPEEQWARAESHARTAIRYFAWCLKQNRWPKFGGAQADAEPIGIPEWAGPIADRRREYMEMELAE